MNEITRWLTEDLIARHTEADGTMECPRCSEIALRVTDEEPNNGSQVQWLYTYECEECGHTEVHVGGLPSWYVS
jgi:predicted nucleic acid-binding Zn ribbon protein